MLGRIGRLIGGAVVVCAVGCGAGSGLSPSSTSSSSATTATSPTPAASDVAVAPGALNLVLGRPTDRSVAASVLAPAGTQVYLEYGTAPGLYPAVTATATAATLGRSLSTAGRGRRLTLGQ